MKQRTSNYAPAPLMNYVLRLEYLTTPTIQPRHGDR